MDDKPKGNDNAAAQLTLIVRYDEVPDRGELERLLDEARGLGEISRAVLEVLKVHTIHLE